MFQNSIIILTHKKSYTCIVDIVYRTFASNTLLL